MFKLGIGLGLAAQTYQKNGRKVPTRYLFIDAASLDARVKQLSENVANGAELSLNWWQVGAGYQKIFFYDALPGQKKSEADEDYQLRRNVAEARHTYLQTFDRFRVYQGDARWRSGRGHEQKKVDVMIAVDMMKHTIRRNMQEAALLASDVDFAPLLNALVDEGMFVTLIYSPGKTSAELLGTADARVSLTSAKMYEWLDEPSRKRLGFISHPQMRRRMERRRLEFWEDEKQGSVQLFEKADGDPGFNEGKFVLQWGAIEAEELMSFEASSPDLALRVAKYDFKLARP